MLSAKELVRAIKDPRADNETPKDVSKFVDWNSQCSQQELEQRISSLFRPLSQPRVAVKSCLNEAVWDEERRHVTITKNCGRQEVGPVLPEECLFLLENNCLLLTRSALPLSLQAAYTLLLTETDLTLERYLVYSKLTREGFKLVKSNPDKIYSDDCEGPAEETESDIDKNMIEPFYGIELTSGMSKCPERRDSCCDWLEEMLEEILTDIVDHVVSLMEKSAPLKRKADWSSHERNSKHFRPENAEPLSPRCDDEDDNGLEVVTLDDNNVNNDEELDREGDKNQIPKVYRNPFHEDSDTSEDEIRIEETVTVPMRPTNRGKRLRLSETTELSPKLGNINNFSKTVSSSIRSQVRKIEEEEKNMPPRVLVEGPKTFLCKVCEILCNTEEMLKNHMQGKPHMKKIKNQKKHCCDICHIECTDANSLVMHLKGKKHLKMMTSIERSAVTKAPEVMILEENKVTALDDEDIEIISQGEKSKEEILSCIPDCSNKSTISWNCKDIFSFVPKNTIQLKKRISSLNVARFFHPNEHRRRRSLEVVTDPADILISVDNLVNKETIRRSEVPEVEEDEEIIVLDDKRKKPVATAVTRPFRGFYSASETVTPLASVGGHYPVIKNFGYHSKPTQKQAPAAGNVWNETRNDIKENSVQTKELESLESLSRRAEEWIASRARGETASPEKSTPAELVDLGSSSSEDEEDESSSLSSDYSDDVAAHSELRYFKAGPLASLWTFENRVGPLISPEMAGSIREIFSRIRMDPLERKYDNVKSENVLDVTYDVHLAENYKKNGRKAPSYRVVIQQFNKPLPSPQALALLDQTYPDSVPFLFAVVSGGTVCFFNMERMTLLRKDAVIPPNAPTELLLDLHCDFISKYGDDPNEYEYAMSEFLRMNGLYWGVAAMDLMNSLERMDREAIIEFVVSCQDEETGGFRPVHQHDPHILNTLSAIQVAVMLDFVDKIDKEAAVRYVVSLQQEDGSFAGDKWGEKDNRFCFCALASLSLLGRLDAVDTNKTANFVSSCQNFDGGFGSRPGAESHAGLIYTCLGSLAITGHLHSVEQERLAWWLAERQLGSGGLNGRPEKLPDVCYSWWVLASLSILGRLHWLDKDKLVTYMLACQDEETGGFADRPGDIADPFHTLFGIAGLSLLGEKTEKIKTVNPVFCMPQQVLDKHKVTHQILN